MKNPRSEEEKIIKNVRNIFRLKKKQNDSAIKYIRNTFRLKKEVKGIKDVVLRNINNFLERKNYYKPARVNNFWSNNYMVYNCKDDKKRIPSVEEYLHRIRPYLRDIINDLKQSDIENSISNNN